MPELDESGAGIRVMVTGSRDWTERGIIRSALTQVSRNPGVESVTVVHGAARGADSIAADAAQTLGYAVEAHPADWETYGKAAGVIRNTEMLNSGIDFVLAFQKGGSRGTAHAVKAARLRGIPVEHWDVQDDYTKAVVHR